MDTVRHYQLSEQPLRDLLRAVEVNRESVQVRVDSEQGSGVLSILGGRLVSATFGRRTGEAAAAELLALRHGSYEVANGPASGGSEKNATMLGVGACAPLGEIARSSGGPTTVPHLESRLVRSGQPLEPGLPPVQLRILSLVDGQRSALSLIRELDATADESLLGIRSLFSAGYLLESRKQTISLGEASREGPKPSASKGASASASEAATSVESAPAEEAPSGRPDADPASAPLKPIGRWAAGPADRARHHVSSTYSSVPPRKLAEERLGAPSSMAGRESSRRRKEHAQQQPSTSSSGQETGAARAESLGAPEVYALARAQLRESEMPVPGDELDELAREQLEELDVAVKSSHRNEIPLDFGGSLLPQSSERTRPSSSRWAPPSSIEGAPPPDELPAPGSVPRSQELPGGSRGQAEAGKMLPSVGRYEVLARLKRGGMGSVYMCRLSGNAGFRRLFAMKVLHGHLANQDQAIDEFFHEARVLGGLHHPNIVSIVDVGTPNEPYLVMDYVEGGSLEELFRASREERDPALVIPLILDALSGIGCAHQMLDSSGEPLGLIHCDLSPHNLLVGIDGSCRVTDFGIAVTRSTTRHLQSVRGKPGYIAPERLEGGDFDSRVDVFSMGVVLYLGLTGVHPFDAGDDLEEMQRRLLAGSVEPPSEVGFRPPPALDWVCMKALARRPEERFQSAEEMSNHLRRIATRDDLLVPPAELARWIRKSLAPALAARRAASLRGTGPSQGLEPFALSTAPPPVAVETSDDKAPSPPAPPDAPSALENTGPLEPPPSSRAFDDRTEVLNRPQNSSLFKKRLTWSLVAAMVGIVVWGLLAPESLSSLFVLEPKQGQVPPAEPSANAETDPAAKPERQPPQESSTPDDPNSVALPPIEPQN